MKRLLVAAVLLGLVGWAIADVKLEAKKPLTKKEVVNNETYGVMLQVDLDEIDLWLASRIKDGLQQYTSVRIEAKYDKKWRVGEYTTRDFVRSLDLKTDEPEPEPCCNKIKDAQQDEAWQFCPFCGEKR